jgi:folate-binding protein YgfZ
MTCLTPLPDRAVIAIEGEDRVAFLQGLVSNDVTAAVPGQAVWAALLTPQGKWLADFFIFNDGTRLLLDCEASQAADLIRRLSRYRLRMKAQISQETGLMVHVAWGGEPDLTALIAADPRLPGFAWRVLSTALLQATATPEDWDRHRLQAGLPDGSRDLEAEQSVLLEAGFDELSGVSWSKGCYMGQELTARTKYRGLLKRRLVPVIVEGPMPEPGTQVLHGEKDAGFMRSGRDGIGLAALRLDALDGPLTCGLATLRPRIPAWMQLPKPREPG